METVGQSDAELVARCRAGEAEAWNTFVERFSRYVYAICSRGFRLGREDAEDVLQETFLKAYTHLSEFEGHSKFYTWLVRIAVNEELDDLERLLDVIADCLRPGARLCVIAFHSLEDRIVKQRLRAMAGRQGSDGRPARFRLLTKHVVVAGEEERLANPRSRSAHLRAAERI